jgi:G3E family GTPase
MKEPDTDRVPLTIIGGFLGAGKTSLLNHIVRNAPGKRIAVLVNDFGAINVDAKLIVSVEGETISLANGCVCCTIRDDLLIEVLKLLGGERTPEHIVIETSGVSSPVPVAETFLDPAVQGIVEVQSLITVLDAELALDEQAEYRDLAVSQVANADLIVINKSDLIGDRDLATLRARIESFVPRARVWETSFGVVPLDLVFGGAESYRPTDSPRKSPLVDRAHTQHDGERFGSWTYRGKRPWSFAALQRAVERMPRDIFRAKGTVRMDLETDDYGILQVTGKRGWLRLREAQPGEVIATELVLIGKPGRISDASIRAHFEQSLDEATTENGDGNIVTDLRAFSVIFAE